MDLFISKQSDLKISMCSDHILAFNLNSEEWIFDSFFDFRLKSNYLIWKNQQVQVKNEVLSRTIDDRMNEFF